MQQKKGANRRQMPEIVFLFLSSYQKTARPLLHCCYCNTSHSGTQLLILPVKVYPVKISPYLNVKVAGKL